MRFQEQTGIPFTWLKGSEQVSEAALRLAGVSREEIDAGFASDPSSRVQIQIVAKKGLVIRLTRNLDKTRGFVNSATAVIEESLCGNEVCVARLRGTGNLILVHPMHEDGKVFLPCCYGYATTIRRAQGSSIPAGAIWFNQKKHAAVRGYGYVAVSRFSSKKGCFMFGRLRQSDFLPVGGQGDAEHVCRGVCSEDTASDDSDFDGRRVLFEDSEGSAVAERPPHEEMPDSGLCVGGAFDEDADAEHACRGAQSEGASSGDSDFEGAQDAGRCLAAAFAGEADEGARGAPSEGGLETDSEADVKRPMSMSDWEEAATHTDSDLASRHWCSLTDPEEARRLSDSDLADDPRDVGGLENATSHAEWSLSDPAASPPESDSSGDVQGGGPRGGDGDRPLGGRCAAPPDFGAEAQRLDDSDLADDSMDFGEQQNASAESGQESVPPGETSALPVRWPGAAASGWRSSSEGGDGAAGGGSGAPSVEGESPGNCPGLLVDCPTPEERPATPELAPAADLADALRAGLGAAEWDAAIGKWVPVQL